MESLVILATMTVLIGVSWAALTGLILALVWMQDRRTLGEG